MFWSVDTMLTAAGLVERHLGPQGRICQDNNASHFNVALYTRSAGRFWYGDINVNQEKTALKRIARGLKETLYVIPGEVFNISNPKMVLLEVTV